ncbi:MAG: heme A synthase [Sphingobacteriales bacterium]|nr:MAG: heme A synthase [Sphingobacteriales bacterium]
MDADRKKRVVAGWILLGIFMLVIQVLLGGITRLTGSGLSITEWKPIMGALPPTNEAAWQNAFDKYQQIAQFKYINSHFTLSDFKFIFFWEWFHRLWARLIAFVFLIPFIYFIARKYFQRWMITPLVILFLLGALQGAVGWIMVKSGLNQEDIYVSHIRLAAHFISAMVLICYALVFWLKLRTQPQEKVLSATLKYFSIGILILLTVQLTYGAFMAGLKAANAAPTWPDINGALIPSLSGKHLVNNHIAVHFIHRTLAYTLLVLVLAWWFKARNFTQFKPFNFTRNLALVLVALQVTLGIFAVLQSPWIKYGKFGAFEWLALIHQLVGMLLLLTFISAAYLLRSRRLPQ